MGLYCSGKAFSVLFLGTIVRPQFGDAKFYRQRFAATDCLCCLLQLAKVFGKFSFFCRAQQRICK